MKSPTRNTPARTTARRSLLGFTLIELLVVIAIIALLVGILLPALAKARQVARSAKSTAQMKNLPTALAAYLADNRDVLPLPQAEGYTAGGALSNGNAMPWAFGGAYCAPRWAATPSVDTPPANRPLNPYIVGDAIKSPEFVVSAQSRGSIQLPVFQSPGDKSSIWNFYFNGQATDAMAFDARDSGYTDVGTSYLMNDLYWQYWIPAGAGGGTGTINRTDMIEAVRRVSRALNSSRGDVSKMVMFYDQVGFAVTRGPLDKRWMGEFGTWNQSVLGFMDGRAAAVELERKLIGGNTGAAGPARFLAQGRGFMYSGRTTSGLIVPSMTYSFIPPVPQATAQAWGIGAN